MTQQNEEQFLTPDEAAKHVGISRRTLERYAEQGLIKRYRRGITRSIFFKRSELEEAFVIRPEDEIEDK